MDSLFNTLYLYMIDSLFNTLYLYMIDSVCNALYLYMIDSVFKYSLLLYDRLCVQVLVICI